jgi:hypothetical protein
MTEMSRLIELGGYAKTAGFEGWLKVEVIAALGNKIREIRNRGADLLLEGGLEIELKAVGNLAYSWIIKEGVIRYKAHAYFSEMGRIEKKLKTLNLTSIDL